MVLMTGNGEKGLSIRTKINNLISYFLEPGHRAKNVALLVASTAFTYSAGSLKTVAAGDIIDTKSEKFSYEVQVLGSANYDIATANGILLNVLPGPNGSINFRAMNPAANGSTDDYPLVQKLLNKGGAPSGFGRRGPSIYFPWGNYFMGSTIELKATSRLYGDLAYVGGNSASLTFAANTAGIVVNRYNTLSTGIETPATTGGDASAIEGLAIRSAGGTDRSKPGIWIKARCTVRSVSVNGFPGNGIQVVANCGSLDMMEGNANVFLIENVVCNNNRHHGFYVDGDCANAGTIINLDCAQNGRCGIYDSSFLGNVYIGCHTATNGVAGIAGNSASQGSTVRFGGRQYAPHWNATEAQLVATQPGTNSNIWRDIGAEYVHPWYPLWQSGQPEGTYFKGYAYHTDNVNAANVFVGCYNEADGVCVFLGPTLVLGGMMPAIIQGNSLAVSAQGQYFTQSMAFSNGNHTVVATDGTGWLTLSHSSDAFPWRLKRDTNGDILLDHANLGARQVFRVTGESAAIPFKFSVAEFLLAGRLHGGATSAPATGTGVAGEVKWNTAGTRGQPFAWMRTNDGTWQPLGLIP